MLRPLLFFIGYDVLSVDEDKGAELVNICSSLGIYYHALGASEGTVKFRMSIASSVRLRKFCSECGICVRLCSRHGLPPLCVRLISRPGIILGVAFFVFASVYLSSRIWDVRIEGNSRVPQSQIKQLLGECGVYTGSNKSELDIDAVQNRFLIMSDDISWISVNIMGSVAEVEVRERVSAPQEVDYACSNLVATKNGVVVELEQVRGNIVVSLGEAVSKGELLVSGVYGDENSATRFVRSKGQVMALCTHEYRIDVPLEFEKKVYTGRKKIKKSLIFFDKEVKLFINSGNLYASCDIIEKEKYFNLFGLGELPFGIKTYEYVEYTVESATRTEAEAAEQANFLLWQGFYRDAPSAALAKKHIVGGMEDGHYVLRALLHGIENIAEEREVEINISG